MILTIAKGDETSAINRTNPIFRSVPAGHATAHVFLKNAAEKVEVGIIVDEGDSEFIENPACSMSDAIAALVAEMEGQPVRPDSPSPLSVSLTSVKVRGGEPTLRSLFEPLGWTMSVEQIQTNIADFDTESFSIRLSGEASLSAALNQLYTLLPYIENDSTHLAAEGRLERGRGWLESHPRSEDIERWYAGRGLPIHTSKGGSDPHASGEIQPAPVGLYEKRMSAVVDVLRRHDAKSVADLGCGSGELLLRLVEEPQIERIFGVDASAKDLMEAATRLAGVDRDRVHLMQGALNYRDLRWCDVDAVTLVEVIEHIDIGRLGTVIQNVFNTVRPRLVVVTTPNVEYNTLFPDFPANKFRHPDHRFEWTRSEFHEWALRVASCYDYRAEFEGIGIPHPTLGHASVMAVFTR